MPDKHATTADHATILGMLRRVDRRVRVNRGLRHVAVSVCVLLGMLLSVQVIRWLLPARLPSASPLVGLWVLGLAAYLAWDLMRTRTLGEAAWETDRRADLKDELKTAYWFFEHDDPSPWTDLQAQRAAGTAKRLDPRRLVPVEAPDTTWIAGAFAVLLAAVVWLPLPTAESLLGGPGEGLGALSRHEEDAVQAIEELMQDAEALEDAAALLEERSISREARERLEEALRRLQQNELSIEELLRELQETQDLLEEGNLDLAALEEGLEDLGKDLSGSEDLAELSEALQNQEMAEAAELLRELAEMLDDLRSAEDLANLGEQLEQMTPPDASELQELLDALQQAAEALTEEEIADAQQALQDAAEMMQALADRMRAQELMNQAAQQLDDLEESMAQQALSQAMMQELMAQAQEEAQAAEEIGMAMPSDEVQWQSGGEDVEGSDEQQGGPAGHATGDPLGGEMSLGEATRLEVQLEIEVLEDPEEPEPPRPEELFDEQSTQEESAIGFRAVRQRSTYAEEAAMSVESIPWRYRNLVKLYFLAIRPRDENGH